VTGKQSSDMLSLTYSLIIPHFYIACLQGIKSGDCIRN